nr:retrovirus-related Pol polyprotein from transposon TNT 1-94 [Tanacetum cinerariifolium]
MAAGQKKPEAQWTPDERKVANLDQRLKSLIMFVLPDDQMNSIINCLTAKSTWDDLILYHEGPSDVKESKVMDPKLCYNTFKFKEGKSLTQTFTRYKALMNELDFQDSLDDEEDTRNSHEYLNDLEEEYQVKALLAKYKRFFKKGTQRFSNAKATGQTECHKCGKKGQFARDRWLKRSVPSYQSPFQSKLLLSSENKPELTQTKYFEAKYHKVKAKLALLSSSALTPNSSSSKNKDLIAKTYDWDDKEVSSNENEVTEVKALMALTDEERVSVGNESMANGDWTKISIKKVHTLLEMEDNDDRNSFLDYMCIDLNYVEEQRNNLLSKCRNLVQELNTCKEQLFVLKQAKIDLLAMQHVNLKILKENQNSRLELKELTSITETWLKSFNKVNQFINEQIPTQKKKIMRINQLTKDTSSFGSKEPILLYLIKILKRYLQMSHKETQLILLVIVSDSLSIDYDLAGESLVCSTLLLSLKKLDGVEPVYGPKTIKPILKLKSRFKAETLKGISINEPSLAPARGKSSSASKTNLAPAGKLKNVKMEDDPILAIMLNSNSHTTSDHNDIECFRKRETLQAKNAESFKARKNDSSSALRSKTPTKRSPNMYKEYLTEFWYSAKALENSKVFFSIPTDEIFREVGVNTFRNAIGAHYLPHSSEYVAPPSIDVVKQWFPMTGMGKRFH